MIDPMRNQIKTLKDNLIDRIFGLNQGSFSISGDSNEEIIVNEIVKVLSMEESQKLNIWSNELTLAGVGIVRASSQNDSTYYSSLLLASQ